MITETRETSTAARFVKSIHFHGLELAALGLPVNTLDNQQAALPVNTAQAAA